MHLDTYLFHNALNLEMWVIQTLGFWCTCELWKPVQDFLLKYSVQSNIFIGLMPNILVHSKLIKPTSDIIFVACFDN